MAQQEEKGDVVISTELASNEQNTIRLNIKASGNKNIGKRFDCKLICNADYNDKETISNIIDAIIQYMNVKHAPVKLKIYMLYFIQDAVWFDNKGYKIAINKAITSYDKKAIRNTTFHVEIMVTHEYKVSTQDITCKHMVSHKSKDPLICPIYSAMMQKHQFNYKNRRHLERYTHFRKKNAEKPECEKYQKCESYIRAVDGGYKEVDLCHMKLYRHPPRSQNIQLHKNIHSFVMHKEKRQNPKVYEPTNDDVTKYKPYKTRGFLLALIEEMISNGFKYDLCLLCSKGSVCKHDVYANNTNALMSIVDQKMNTEQHIVRGSPLTEGQMLAMLIYTGCDANYDLCGAQRGGNYVKWKWLDYCLYKAIFKLSCAESGTFPVYSGLKNVHLVSQSVDAGFFVTYVSTSWNKRVAEGFMGKEKGLIFHFDESFKNHYRVKCCDVSWISKFESECEILFARHTVDYYFDKGFKCEILDDCDGIQTVSLFKRLTKK